MLRASRHRVLTLHSPPSILKGLVTLAMEETLAWFCRWFPVWGTGLVDGDWGSLGAYHLALSPPGSFGSKFLLFWDASCLHVGGNELAWDKPLGSQSPPHVMTFKENTQTAFGPFSKRGSSHCAPFLPSSRTGPFPAPLHLLYNLHVPQSLRALCYQSYCFTQDLLLSRLNTEYINNQFCSPPWLPSTRLEPLGWWFPTQNFSDDSLPQANSTIKSVSQYPHAFISLICKLHTSQCPLLEKKSFLAKD